MNITKDVARQYLRDYVKSITKVSKGKNQFICPLCGSGEGKHGTGAFTITDDGKNWKCFACDEGGDVFDLIGKYEGLQGYKNQKEWFEGRYNVTIDRDNVTRSTTTTAASKPNQDYNAFFVFANADLDKTDYHRGISEAVLQRFNVGYVANWKHPKAPEAAPTTPRLIIPTSSESYLARDTRSEVPENQRDYTKQKVGPMHIFNLDTLRTTTTPVFVVEGEIDAMSIIDAGAEAVALGSVSMVKRFIDLVKAIHPKAPLIIALDNDEAGRKAAETLQEGLKAANLISYRETVAAGYKDANEALNKDPNALRANVQAILDTVKRIQDQAEAEERESYKKTAAAYSLQGFIDGIKDSVNTPVYSTGFLELDNMLDGGLYEGLYILGAISSLGKTALVMQLADQLAEAGHDVLYFSLEMSANELIARSISRHTAKYVIETGKELANAKTARGITDGRKYAGYTDADNQVIKAAINRYAEYAAHVYIHEGLGNIDVKYVRDVVEKHIHYTGVTPVVVIDYMQILAPWDPRATDKQNTDRAVFELKRISRDFKLPLIGISSFNRANYSTPVTMEAFKESGAIEYSADVLLGLQLHGAGSKNFDVDKAKEKNPREIELKVLKNRSGRTGGRDYFDYYAMFNLFQEANVLDWNSEL